MASNRADYMRQWKVKNPDKVRAYRAAARARPDAERRRYATDLKRFYRIMIAEYDAMVIAQGGRCAICAKPTYALRVDHNHRTKQVRALLCDPCNLAVGHLKDDPERGMALVSYLIEHEGVLV